MNEGTCTVVQVSTGPDTYVDLWVVTPPPGGPETPEIFDDFTAATAYQWACEAAYRSREAVSGGYGGDGWERLGGV